MKVYSTLLLTRPTWELIGLIAGVIMLAGVWLNWRRQWHLAEIEEDVKNGKLTTEQAWRRSRFVNWRASAVIVSGVVLLIAFVLGLAW